ncbi:MAG: hypothetical protein IJF12_04585 [Alphaproteobacteria bacterium]|nr:hypothetical protein [Alphaproteobacteria bacterium]MBQ2811429.1 hypothetical protein [Alphaproteobacteria bacterium]
MEIFLFIALFFIYVLTAFTVPEVIVKRVWILAYVSAFIITAVSILFISTSKQTVLMQESQLNWYYFLYLFGSMSLILGLINVWIYRKDLLKIFSSSEQTEN